MYRQGDVYLVPVSTIPSDAKRVPAPIILAHGEATGHAHEIKSRNAKLFESAGQRFLRLTKAAVLEHQEHDPVTLPAGEYEVIRQVEYTPEAIVHVAD